MINKSCNEICKWIDGAELCHAEDVAIKGVSIDSRQVQPGNLFIPLKGERVDGHRYLESAVHNGASAALWNVDEPLPEFDFPLILVKDTMSALTQLAKGYRDNCDFQVVGITGSNGKTSTKDMIAGVLSAKAKVMKTLGNHNNEIGVPLTLLSFDEDCEIVVVEMGMENLHEIEQLCRLVRPNIGIITNVGSAHLENLGSMENIARAKCELMDGLPEDGLFIYNMDDPYLVSEIKQHDYRNLKVYGFSMNAASDCRCVAFKQDEAGISFKTSLSERYFELHMLGEHQALNACAALLVGKYFEMSDELIQKGFDLVENTGMRNQLEKIGRWTVLNDSYKSNPQSAMAALKTFSYFSHPYKIVLMGDMLDLGEDTYTYHRNLGEACARSDIQECWCYGELGKEIAVGAKKENPNLNVRHFTTHEAVEEAISQQFTQPRMLLVKGSRGMHLDLVIDWMKEQVDKDEEN